MSKCAQLKDLVFLIVTVPKILKIGQKLTEIWQKHRFFKNMLLILILKIAFEIAFDLNMVYIASQ